MCVCVYACTRNKNCMYIIKKLYHRDNNKLMSVGKRISFLSIVLYAKIEVNIINHKTSSRLITNIWIHDYKNYPH